MKAPDQTYHTPERGVQNINYSMLPPDKLPNWLLEKNTPAKVYNYSMHSPGNQPPVVGYVQERDLASREMLRQAAAMPPAAIESPVVENVQAAPENILEVVATAPEVQDNAPGTTDKVSSVTESDFQEKEADADAANAIENETKAGVYVSEDRDESVRSWQAPSPPAIQPDSQAALPAPVESPGPPQSAGQQEYPSNAARPASESFAGYILNNSKASMIIVVGIIIFSIVLIILLALGVV